MAKTEVNIPKVRFKGFSDAWHKRKLSEFSSRVQEKNKDNQITETFTNSAERGIINQRDFFDKDISNEANLDSYYIVRPNDFVYNPRISNFAPVGPIKRNKLGRSGVMSPLYSVFRPDFNLVNLDYLEHYFSTTNWHKFMFTHGDQGARADRFAIGMVTFQKMPILLPKLQEQTQIGYFFQKLDQVIELQQKALETTKDYKKSMLQKMFPQKGEKVPQIRFDGFSGDWEETLLGEITKINRGLTYKPENIVKEQQGVRVLRSSNINENVLVLNSDDVFIDAQVVKLDNICVGDILITAANGSSRLVGKHAVVTMQLDNTVHGGFMLTARTDMPYFINSWMNTTEYKLMLQLVQGGNGAIGNLSKLTLEKCKIHIPASKEEQQKIGAFFQKLDQQIEQQEKKLENYQQLKKAMLQRLFV